MMLRRNLIHTGVTCGKRLAVLVGQRKAIGIAVRSAEGGRRLSKLRELLEGAILRSCPRKWCRIGVANHPGSQQSGRVVHGPMARSMMGVSSPSGAMVSSVM